MMQEVEKGNVVPESIWIRGLYMLLFGLLYSVAEVVLWTVVLVQFIYRVFNDETQPRLLELGASVSRYIYQVLRFLSFNTEVMPFPFSDWPLAADDDKD